MTDAAKQTPEPDQELLEFLGDIDQANDENQDEDFSEFLANNDIDKLKDQAGKPHDPAQRKPEKAKPEKGEE
jgi:hypothetical protein